METSSRWRRITDNPTLILITSSIVVSIATVASLVAIWEFFMGENFPQFLTRKGWEITMPSWYYSLVIVFLCITTILQIKLTRVVLARRQRELRSLEALAQDHSKTMPHRVQIVREKLSVTLNLNDTIQYVIFHITIFNRSIYPLTLEEKVYEHFTFEGTRLMEEARIHETKAMTAKPVNYFCFSIKQYIPSSVASHIQSQEASTFGANNVTVQFTYRDYTGAPKHVRVSLAHQIPVPSFSNFNFVCQIPIISPD